MRFREIRGFREISIPEKYSLEKDISFLPDEISLDETSMDDISSLPDEI